MAEATVARLYEGYSRQLYRYCLKHLRSHEDAEDAVQNTFLRVHAALGRGVVPEFESAWLYKIAHNVCLSRCLGAKRRSSVEAPHDLQQLEERMGAPVREGDELVGLDDALARMPEKLRRAILLREWQGLRYAEIAEALGITCSAAETLIFRARRYLARELESSSGRQLRLASNSRGFLTGPERADPPALRRGCPQKLAAAPRWRSYAPDSTIAPISSTA